MLNFLSKNNSEIIPSEYMIHYCTCLIEDKHKLDIYAKSNKDSLEVIGVLQGTTGLPEQTKSYSTIESIFSNHKNVLIDLYTSDFSKDKKTYEVDYCLEAKSYSLKNDNFKYFTQKQVEDRIGDCLVKREPYEILSQQEKEEIEEHILYIAMINGREICKHLENIQDKMPKKGYSKGDLYEELDKFTESLRPVYIINGEANQSKEVTQQERESFYQKAKWPKYYTICNKNISEVLKNIKTIGGISLKGDLYVSINAIAHSLVDIALEQESYKKDYKGLKLPNKIIERYNTISSIAFWNMFFLTYNNLPHIYSGR